jgi:hypothetical protein
MHVCIMNIDLGVILLGDQGNHHIFIKASLFRWFGRRRLCLIKMMILEYSLAPSWFTYNYMDQFRYTQHIVTRGSIRHDYDRYC